MLEWCQEGQMAKYEIKNFGDYLNLSTGPFQNQTAIRPYTQQQRRNSPILPKGTEAEKERIWDIFNQISSVPEGKKLCEQLQKNYQLTKTPVAVFFDVLPSDTAASYASVANEIRLNPKQSKATYLDSMLAHELRHTLQNNRILSTLKAPYPTIKDFLIAAKLEELETKIQDIVYAHEKNKTDAVDPLTKKMLYLYRQFLSDGQKIFPNDENLSLRYAKTEMAKTLWENKKIPFWERVFHMFKKNDKIRAYKAVNDWNDGYNLRTAEMVAKYATNIIFTPYADSKKSDELFNSFSYYMGVNLTPDYYRENLSMLSFCHFRSDNSFYLEGYGSLSLRLNLKGKVELNFIKDFHNSELSGLYQSIAPDSYQNIYDKTGKVLASVWKRGDTNIDGNLKFQMTEHRYFKNGKLKSVHQFDGRETYYYQNGNLMKKTDANKKTIEYYSPDGKALVPEEDIISGKKSSVFCEFDNAGNLIRKTPYARGQKHGTEILYSDRTQKEIIWQNGKTKDDMKKNFCLLPTKKQRS